jgi:hypothetical protein
MNITLKQDKSQPDIPGSTVTVWAVHLRLTGWGLSQIPDLSPCLNVEFNLCQRDLRALLLMNIKLVM